MNLKFHGITMNEAFATLNCEIAKLQRAMLANDTATMHKVLKSHNAVTISIFSSSKWAKMPKLPLPRFKKKDMQHPIYQMVNRLR